MSISSSFENSSGHRIGTAEVESALVSHPKCAEAAVVGIDHEVSSRTWIFFLLSAPYLLPPQSDRS